MKGYVNDHFKGVPESDTLGRRLSQVREHVGLDYKGMAQRTGLSVRQIKNLEGGLQRTTRAEMPSCDSIARTFNVQPAWLFGGSAVPRRLWPEWWTP